MSNITLVGLGCGSIGSITLDGREAISKADLVVGARRLLESIECKEIIEEIKPAGILQIIKENPLKHICVVYSGDTGFYSGTTKLAEMLREEKIEYRIVPGISSVQAMSARLGVPWQDWNLVSAHGRDCNILGQLMKGKDTFFLTGGEVVPKDICQVLVNAGLGKTKVNVGERLSYEDEKVTRDTAEHLKNQDFHKLAVVLVEKISVPQKHRSGIDDGEFIRGKIPMTKRDVRSSVLSRMDLAAGDTVWDVGAGTGSVSIEMALAAPMGRVFAIECVPEGCDLIRKNREKFRTWNLTVVEGKAPTALENLPTPDAVFIGGTRGNLHEILDFVYAENPKARVCITAIALESLTNSLKELTERGMEVQIVQISSSWGKPIGPYQMLKAENPIFIITGEVND